jgi:RND family efflux transporter MFP subunit
LSKAKRSIGFIAAATACALCRAASAGDLNELAANSSCLMDANSIVKLSSTTQGTLADVLVKRGDRVQVGQVVARLESDVEQAMYEAAQLKAQSDVVIKAKAAAKANADRKRDRMQQLQSRAVASIADLDDANTDAAVALYELEEAKLDQKLATSEAKRLKAIIERRIVRSPVNGVVTKVDLHAGEFADPSVPIATIAEMEPIIVEIYLPVAAYPFVQIGMRAEVRPQEPIGGAYVADVATKDPQIDSASGTFQVTLKLPNKKALIPSGLRCRVRFLE